MEDRSTLSFRLNYQRVANTLRLERDLVWVQALRGESVHVDADNLSEEENFDGDDDDDEEMTPPHGTIPS